MKAKRKIVKKSDEQRRVTVYVSLKQGHRKILDLHQSQTGLKISDVLRLLIEETSDCRFHKTLFGFELRLPKFREDLGEDLHEK
jgi:hypothetical protein